jgi:hypothetical protein
MGKIVSHQIKSGAPIPGKKDKWKCQTGEEFPSAMSGFAGEHLNEPGPSGGGH